MMELNDSGTELTATTTAQSETRSPLGIDLNEIPACLGGETLFPEPDALAVVRNIHYNLTPAEGAPAEIPGEEKCCAACRLPEMRGRVVVCDGCERGFHLSCGAAQGRRQPESAADEWVCGECMSCGVKSKRWPLGLSSSSSFSSSSGSKRGGVRLLDINALPPSDGEGEGSEDLWDSRKHIPGDNSFGGNPFGVPVTYSNLYVANGFGFQRASEILMYRDKLGFGDILHRAQAMARGCEEVNFGIPIGWPRCSNDTAVRAQSRISSEILLQSLNEFVSERHGVLGEGWTVEVRKSLGSRELCAVYCAPDGRTFESMSDVAGYLGLMSNGNSIDSELKSEDCASQQKRLRLHKRRKSTRISVANGSAENIETLMSGIHKGLSSDMQNMETFASKFVNNGKYADVGLEETGVIGCQKFNEELPLQYEDFFVLSLGRIDIRPSYHNISNIWPVGYRSCFHDRITGSLFICDVEDGGDRGPVFRVRRCSCSMLPIPIGSTILLRPNNGQFDGQNKKSDCMNSFRMDSEEDASIQMILSDACPPVEDDIMSCLGYNPKEACDVHSSNHLHVEADKMKLILGDEIGEFSEEGPSSSSVWRMVSDKITEACSEIYERTGTLKFFCRHFENPSGLPYWDATKDETSIDGLTSLTKFCSLSGYVKIASITAYELEMLTKVLRQWLEQDRFGLDVEFVQEIIEQLPGVQTCSQYEFLNKRNCYSTLPAVGNGNLLVKTKSGVQGKEEALNGLFKRCKRDQLQAPVMENHDPPSGKPLGSRIPPELVGDVLQVLEFFWRFYEVLGLKEALSFKELEDELISPWSDDLSVLERFGREFQESQDKNSNRTRFAEYSIGHIFSSNSDSGPAASDEDLPAFVQMETEAMKEAAQARIASITYSRCTGVALTKAHNALLKVLVTELQSKVAGIMDPSLDAGEFKSRRGKRKDVDTSAIAKKSKLNMLPINELTWPELARRYILAFLTMDGSHDSIEITMRESCKVFRCLQGDGGVLCGSLTGVAGMQADALLLAEATKRIFGSVASESGTLTVEDVEPSALNTGEVTVENEGNSGIPEWAKILEPVRKLPTNVGTRIRKCVYDALEKDPPDWAREILEHSISKAVYKGNASGPTKKAVLSVLANVSGEVPQRRPERERERKRKSVVSIPDIIMKQCRIVLRRAAAEDDAKFFCNLLGRNLMNFSDNDDEGLLGSPAMVSRPLDFRTIDLRLAVGAYGGSHESFLEDVRELWNNVRTAFVDQPDLVELADTLSQNFESLYENEVLTLVQKLMEYAKLECLSAEMKKEINDIVLSTSEIPKAPWDEGVCKVCGIDRDDDSVLLCDTCDAEYHTYCLNPPLARIPEGNWYCPSCVSGKSIIKDVSQRSQVICQHRRRKYRGENTRLYLEALTNLAAVMEEKEYWDCSTHERTFLLKFLTEELLNSTLIRQHLEQCAEASADLQQKLRAISVECRNLKLREEILASRAVKVDKGLGDLSGDVVTLNGPATAAPDLGKCMERQSSGRSNHISITSDEPQRPEEGTRHYSYDKQISVNNSERNHTCNDQALKPLDTKDVHTVGNGTSVHGSLLSGTASQKNDESCVSDNLPLSNPVQKEISSQISFQCSTQECMGRDASVQPSSDSQGLSFSLNKTSTHILDCVPAMTLNESQPCELELNSVKDDILLLQDSIFNLELQLLKQTVRKEFLGSDSAGRLYWVTSIPGQHPCVIVDRSLALQQERKMTDCRNLKENFVASNSTSSKDTISIVGGSQISHCFLYGRDGAVQVCSPWVSYQSNAEIEELICWLDDKDPKERELKESILHLRKLRFQDYQQTRNRNQEDHQEASSRFTNSSERISSDMHITKAAAFLEKKYGPCFDPEGSDILRKRGRKVKVISEGKMYRCECLEPIWPSRHHCLSCHRTFSSKLELEGHNDGRCILGPSAAEKGKENGECLKGKGIMRSDSMHEDCTGDMEKVEASKSGSLEHTSRLIKYQNEGLICPYNFEEICSKFVTKDCNRDLVQEIGLIGLDGVPSFVPSVSPYVSESTLSFVSQKDIDIPADEPKAVEKPVFSQGNGITTNPGPDIADNTFRGCAANKAIASVTTDRLSVRCWEQKDKKSPFSSCGPEMDVGHCCVVSQSALRPLVGKVSQILRHLKINLLDMDAALSEEALRPSKGHLEKRWAWRTFLKSAQNIFEMVQATIILEDMIKTEFLGNGWWYWSSLSAAAKISTVSSLALRICTLDAAIIYEKIVDLDSTDNLKSNSKQEQKALSGLDLPEKYKGSRKGKKRRKESEG